MRVIVLYENVYLNSYPYSKYQKYIFEQIIKFRKMGYSDRKISNYFNENGIKTTRGRKFSCFNTIFIKVMGYSDRKISNYFNENGIKTTRGRKFSCGLVWMLRKNIIRVS